MKNLLFCLLYLAFLGIISFPIGRVFAMWKLNPYEFPFREYSWEQGGRVYEQYLNIRKWKDRVPDVSKALPGIVPKKKMKIPNISDLDKMIHETCIAELTHLVLCFLGVPVLFIVPGIPGVIVFIIDVFPGNLSFAVIQRYNRFRYISTRRKIESITVKREYRDRA